MILSGKENAAREYIEQKLVSDIIIGIEDFIYTSILHEPFKSTFATSLTYKNKNNAFFNDYYKDVIISGATNKLKENGWDVLRLEFDRNTPTLHFSICTIAPEEKI